MKDTMREIVFRGTVVLPALSTAIHARDYPFGAFLHEFVLQAPDMRKDENLAMLFEWEEAVEAFFTSTKACVLADESLPKEPAKPEPPKLDTPGLTEAAGKDLVSTFIAQMEEHNEARKPYERALADARVGGIIYVSDAAFKAAKVAAQKAIDARVESTDPHKPAMDPAWHRKVLRHYYALIQSRAVTEVDVPVSAKRLSAVA